MKFVIPSEHRRLSLKRSFVWVILILVLLFNVQLSGQGSVQTCRVTDDQNIPIQGARIYIEDQLLTTSDQQGMFYLSLDIEKHLKLHITKDGFRDYDTQFEFVLQDHERIRMIRMEMISDSLPEVRLTGTREMYNRHQESLQVLNYNEDFLITQYSGNLMQTLRNIPGVQSMDIGSGMSKPVIRGMSFYRIAVAESGVKQEGQQWSSHHGISIDPSRVKNIEIIKGPATLKYGSDAMGGLIHILPPEIPAEDGSLLNVQFISRSNTKWRGLSGDLFTKKGNIFTYFQASYNSFGDFSIPATDSFLLPAPVSSEQASHKVELGEKVLNTAGEDFGLSLYSGFKTKKLLSCLELSLFNQKTGFFDWEGLKLEKNRTIHSENSFDILTPNQNNMHFNLIHQTSYLINDDKMDITAGYQRNSTQEFSVLFDRTGNRVTDLKKYIDMGGLDLQLILSVASLQIQYAYNRIPELSIKTGISTQFQVHQKDGFNHILPAYNKSSSGIFSIGRYQFSSILTANFGVRIDHNYIFIEKTLNTDPEFGDAVLNGEIKKHFVNASFSGGLVYIPIDDIIFKVNAGKTFRVPSVYELAAYGLHRHEGRFEKGNQDISPEQGYQLDLVGDFKWNTGFLAISPFFSWYSNYLYINPTPVLRPEGQVYEYKQHQAILTGFEISFLQKAGEIMELNMGFEYVYAVNTDLRRPLPSVPPMNVLTELLFKLPDWKFFKNSRFGLDMSVASGQIFTVPNELTTPGYSIFGANAKTSFEIKTQQIDLIFKINNLANAQYFNHISFYRRLRIPEPGRDIQLIISIPLDLIH